MAPSSAPVSDPAFSLSDELFGSAGTAILEPGRPELVGIPLWSENPVCDVDDDLDDDEAYFLDDEDDDDDEFSDDYDDDEFEEEDFDTESDDDFDDDDL